MQKLLGSLKLHLTCVAKGLAKKTILTSLSLLHPKFTRILIRILQQRIGFGYDSGLTTEVIRFSKEAQKFKVENPVVLDIGANIGTWSIALNSQVINCAIHAFEPSKVTTPEETVPEGTICI